ncbi:MAG: hypothetical protein ACYSW2_20505 [Planctomycetota bacterium]
MTDRDREDVTRLLAAAGEGDEQAAEQLLPLVYETWSTRRIYGSWVTTGRAGGTAGTSTPPPPRRCGGY